MLKMNFNYTDIFRAPRIALSIQKLWIQLVGLFTGMFFYILLSYAGFLLSGASLADSWEKFGLLPCLFATGEAYPWYAWAAYFVGSLILVLAVLVTNTAVSRATYMDIKGNNFYNWREAFAFAMRKSVSVILTPLSVIILAGLFIFGIYILGLLGKIPVVGELGISLFTIIWFLLSLLLLFFFVVACIAAIIAPAIIATTDEDAFEAVFQSFVLTWRQPWRLIGYQVTNLLLSVVAVGILAFVVKESFFILNALFANFMGADYSNLANNGQGMVQSWLLMAQPIVESIYKDCSTFVFFSREFLMIPASDLSGSVVISSYFYAISLLFIIGFVVSYGLSAFNAGSTLTYIVLRKIKDDENLLERTDKEEGDEEETEEEVVSES